MITASRVSSGLDVDWGYTLRPADGPDGGSVRATTYDVPKAILDGSEVVAEPAGGTGIAIEVAAVVQDLTIADGGSVRLEVHADGDKGFALSPVIVHSVPVTAPGSFRLLLDTASLEQFNWQLGHRGVWIRTAAIITGVGNKITYRAWVTRTIGS